MGYHLIMDSVGDRPDDLIAMDNFSVVPLKLIIDDEELIDNGQIDQIILLDKIAASKDCPRSACASPETYKRLFKRHKEDRIYVITGSSELTGSYNSAMLGKNMFLEEFPDSEIVIIDSRSASAGETLLAYKIIELEEKQLSFEEVIETINNFIKQQETIFVLEDLTFLQKNGRLTGIKALLAIKLNIVPILNAQDGVIDQMGKARGIKRGLERLKEIAIDGVRMGKKKMLVISHCNCIERAENFKEELTGIFPDLDVKITDTGGIATLYAGDCGIVMSY